MEEHALPQELLDSIRELFAVGDFAAKGEGLTRTVELAAQAVPGCDVAGATLVEGTRLTTRASTGPLAAELDRLQAETRQGPCIDSARTSETYLVESMSSERRWPDFSAKAAATGVNSLLAIPLQVEGDTLGAFNFYSRSDHAFHETDIPIAALFASRAALGLATAQLVHRSATLILQLREALRTREVIGEAKGILMERENVSGEEAFRMLVTMSQNTNTKLRDIAERLVTEKRRDQPDGRSGPT